MQEDPNFMHQLLIEYTMWVVSIARPVTLILVFPGGCTRKRWSIDALGGNG